MITQNLNKVKTISSSSLSGLTQIVDYNFGQIVAGLNSFLAAIVYNASINKMALSQLDVTGDVQLFSSMGFGPDRTAPTLKITADGKISGQALAAPVINATRLRFADFSTVSTISKPGVVGEVVYVAPGAYTEGFYGYTTSSGWVPLSGGTSSGGSSTLSGLTDVSLSSVSNGDFLVYNTTDNKWENSQFTINVNDFFAALNTVLTESYVPYWNGLVLTNSLMTNDSINGIVNINGELTATSKSFLIDHPTKKGHSLRYGSLEGPEHAIYFRGRSTSNSIKLPKYWKALIDESTITVSLTPIGSFHELYVDEIDSNNIKIGGSKKKAYFFTVFAERKDVNKLVVEFKNKKTK